MAIPRQPGDEVVTFRDDSRGDIMIVLGIVLAVVFGWLIPIPILLYLGIILIIVGVILEVLGTAGRAIGGRRHYY